MAGRKREEHDAVATAMARREFAHRSVGRPWLALLREERGAATAEYAVITVAAVGIAGLLALVLRSDEVRGLLTDLVHRALTIAG